MTFLKRRIVEEAVFILNDNVPPPIIVLEMFWLFGLLNQTEQSFDSAVVFTFVRETNIQMIINKRKYFKFTKITHFTFKFNISIAKTT